MSRQNSVADQLRDLGDYGVSCGPKSAHVGGKPIIDSAKDAVGYPSSSAATCSAKFHLHPGSPTHLLASECSFNSATRFPSDLIGVGQYPDPFANLGESNGPSGNNSPPSIIPPRGQASENGIQPSIKQRSDVLQDNEAWSQFANKTGDLKEQPAPFSFKPRALSSGADILAGESPADRVNGNSIGSKSLGCEFAHVAIAWDVWPVLCEDTTGKLLYFAERDGLETARSLKAQRETADAGKQVEDAQLVHDASPCPTSEAPL